MYVFENHVAFLGFSVVVVRRRARIIVYIATKVTAIVNDKMTYRTFVGVLGEWAFLVPFDEDAIIMSTKRRSQRCSQLSSLYTKFGLHIEVETLRLQFIIQLTI